MSGMEDVRTRALSRRKQLLDRYGGTLDLLADIYRDEDWRRIEDCTTGLPYATFTRFVASELKVSAAYARRTAQAIRELVLPLREKAGAQAAAAITLTDMENLGSEGARRLIAELDPLAQSTEPEQRASGGMQEMIRARIVAIASTRESEQERGSAATGAVSMTAAAVPATRSTQPDRGITSSPAPWTGPAAVGASSPSHDEPVQQAGQCEGGIGAVLDEILTADPAVAARELAGRESDLSRAAVALTRIRAHLLASFAAV